MLSQRRSKTRAENREEQAATISYSNTVGGPSKRVSNSKWSRIRNILSPKRKAIPQDHQTESIEEVSPVSILSSLEGGNIDSTSPFNELDISIRMEVSSSKNENNDTSPKMTQRTLEGTIQQTSALATSDARAVTPNSKVFSTRTRGAWHRTLRTISPQKNGDPFTSTTLIDCTVPTSSGHARPSADTGMMRHPTDPSDVITSLKKSEGNIENDIERELNVKTTEEMTSTPSSKTFSTRTRNAWQRAVRPFVRQQDDSFTSPAPIDGTSHTPTGQADSCTDIGMRIYTRDTSDVVTPSEHNERNSLNVVERTLHVETTEQTATTPDSSLLSSRAKSVLRRTFRVIIPQKHDVAESPSCIDGTTNTPVARNRANTDIEMMGLRSRKLSGNAASSEKKEGNIENCMEVTRDLETPEVATSAPKPNLISTWTKIAWQRAFRGLAIQKHVNAGAASSHIDGDFHTSSREVANNDTGTDAKGQRSQLEIANGDSMEVQVQAPSPEKNEGHFSPTPKSSFKEKSDLPPGIQQVGIAPRALSSYGESFSILNRKQPSASRSRDSSNGGKSPKSSPVGDLISPTRILGPHVNSQDEDDDGLESPWGVKGDFASVENSNKGMSKSFLIPRIAAAVTGRTRSRDANWGQESTSESIRVEESWNDSAGNQSVEMYQDAFVEFSALRQDSANKSFVQKFKRKSVMGLMNRE